eukprot:4354934-Heterocapsa_arctica.AAC.1
MLRVLKDVRRQRISPATIQIRAAVWGDVRRSSNARHVPGKVVGWELWENTLFQAGLTAEQAPQNVAGLGNAVP